MLAASRHSSRVTRYLSKTRSSDCIWKWYVLRCSDLKSRLIPAIKRQTIGIRKNNPCTRLAPPAPDVFQSRRPSPRIPMPNATGNAPGSDAKTEHTSRMSLTCCSSGRRAVGALNPAMSMCSTTSARTAQTLSAPGIGRHGSDQSFPGATSIPHGAGTGLRVGPAERWFRQLCPMLPPTLPATRRTGGPGALREGPTACSCVARA